MFKSQDINFQVLNSWQPSTVIANKDDKFEFGKFLFIPTSHQIKIIECRLEGESSWTKIFSMIDHLVYGHGHPSQVTAF